MPIPAANASALKQLADANNQYYRDAKNLPANATPSQIMSLQKQDFGPALGAMNAEHNQKFSQWKKAMRNSVTETKDEIARLLGGKNAGKDGGKGAPGAPGTGMTAPMAQQNREQGRASEGATGAKETTFTHEKKLEDIKVNNDGIITDQ